jgi:hypothetical protein
MYTHKVTIKRSNKDVPFLYENISKSNNYKLLIDNYRNRNLVVGEEFITSSDGLTMERLLHFTDKPSHDMVLSELSVYERLFQEYLDSSGHQVNFESYESNSLIF